MALVDTNPPKKYMYAYPRGIASNEITIALTMRVLKTRCDKIEVAPNRLGIAETML